MNWINGLFGIVKDFFQGRREIKKLELEQKKEIIIAETLRIKANTIADNDIDFQTNKDKKHTVKDDILIYMSYLPFMSASVVPFIRVYQNGDYHNLNNYVLESYTALSLLPLWYQIFFFLVVVDVLGFRSFARNFVNKYSSKLNIFKNKIK